MKRLEVILETREKAIIENFDKVSRQLGIIVENGLVKYAIYANPFSYPNSKHGFFNKKLNKFIDNGEVSKYPKEDFVCNIDDVKLAKQVAAKTDFNANDITWEVFTYFEDRFYRNV